MDKVALTSFTTQKRETVARVFGGFLDKSMRFHIAPLIEELCIQLGPRCPIDADIAKWVAKAVDRCGVS